MKNRIFTLRTFSVFVTGLLMLSLAFACKKDRPPAADVVVDFRSIAWNYLTVQQQSTVTINWRETPVKDVTYEGKAVKSVMFSTTQDALLGPIIVYISVDTKSVLGIGARF